MVPTTDPLFLILIYKKDKKKFATKWDERRFCRLPEMHVCILRYFVPARRRARERLFCGNSALLVWDNNSHQQSRRSVPEQRGGRSEIGQTESERRLEMLGRVRKKEQRSKWSENGTRVEASSESSSLYRRVRVTPLRDSPDRPRRRRGRRWVGMPRAKRMPDEWERDAERATGL